MGDALEVEIDVENDDGASQSVWAAASVSRVDAAAGEFYVDVSEWAELSDDDPEYEPPYEEGPFTQAQEGAYVDGLEGRWRRPPRVSAAWSKVADKGSAWWRQDSKSVTLVVPLPVGASFKRDVSFALRDDWLSLRVAAGGARDAVAIEGRPSHAVDVDESEWFVEEEPPAGFDGFGAGARFLVAAIRKATPNVEWQSLTLVEGAVRADRVTVRDDGNAAAGGTRVTIKRPDGSRTEPAAVPSETSGTATTDGGVQVTIRRRSTR